MVENLWGKYGMNILLNKKFKEKKKRAGFKKNLFDNKVVSLFNKKQHAKAKMLAGH